MEIDDGIHTPRKEESSKYIDQEVADLMMITKQWQVRTVVNRKMMNGSSQKKMRMKVASQRMEVMVRLKKYVGMTTCCNTEWMRQWRKIVVRRQVRKMIPMRL